MKIFPLIWGTERRVFIITTYLQYYTENCSQRRNIKEKKQEIQKGEAKLSLLQGAWVKTQKIQKNLWVHY